uniref:Potassium two pore domain channel subfamily K member 4 n=1 Tax=Cyprinodon variegatus TaxID=28743 RepID=A0A3Q2CQ62_CYPVA
MRCSTLLVIFTGVLLYLVLGALVFRSLEAPLEEKEHTVLMQKTLDFLSNNSCIDRNVLNDYKVLDAVGAGVSAEAAILNETFITNWDIASALFFSGTIMTTIGYGNISPKSDGGKLFCIVYALVGIPMFGILLAGVGDHLGTGLQKTVGKIEKLFLKWRISPTIVRVISAVLSILLGVLLFLAVPTLVFQEVENWSLLESAYFVVITLTTVGFGDYVAGHGSPQSPLVWFWILLGLAYFASILSMIANWLRVLSKKTRAEVLSFSVVLPESGSETETDSQATQTDRVPATEAPPDSLLPQPLDFLAENFAFIDESSDAQSGKVDLEPVQESKPPNSRHAKRRRHRRPTHRRSSKTNYSTRNKKQPNGDTTPVPDVPKKPPE